MRRAVSGRAAAGPIEITFGAERELVRRVYVSALSSDAREREPSAELRQLTTKLVEHITHSINEILVRPTAQAG